MAKLFYGIKDGNYISIENAERGINCDCTCPSCKEHLIAKKGNIVIHHFAHISNSNCKYAFEKSLYYIINDVLISNKHIILPKLIAQFHNKHQILQEPQFVQIEKITCEENEKHFPILQIHIQEGSIQIIVLYRNNNRIYEFTNQKTTSIYIDLRDTKNHEFSLTELKKYINGILQSSDSKYKKWIYHPLSYELEQQWKQNHLTLKEVYNLDNFSSNITNKEKNLYEQYGIEKIPDSCFTYPKNCPFVSKKYIENNKIKETKMKCDKCFYFQGLNNNKTFIICENKHNDKLYNKLPEIPCTQCKQSMTPTIKNNTFYLTCKTHPYNPKTISCPNCGSSIIWNAELNHVECLNSPICSFTFKIE